MAEVATNDVSVADVGRPGPDRRLAARLLAASIVALGLTAAGYLLMIRTAIGQRFDRAAYLGALGQNPEVVAVNRSVLQRITTDSLLVVLLGLVAIGLARRRPRLGLGAAFAAGIAVVGTDFFKQHIFSRPDLTYPFSANTYPSGHTATACACAMALVLVSPPRLRGVAAVVAGAYGWITAAQVQSAGWHRPSDAIGAAFLAFAAVTAVAGAVAWTRPVRTASNGLPWGSFAALATVAAIATAGTAWGLVRVLDDLSADSHLSEPSHAVRHVAYLTGLAMTVDVVVILLMILLALLGRRDLDVPRP